MKERTKQELAQHHLDEWQKSGLTKEAYCKQNNLYKGYLYSWANRLKSLKDSSEFVEVTPKPKVEKPNGVLQFNVELTDRGQLSGQFLLKLADLFKQ